MTLHRNATKSSTSKNAQDGSCRQNNDQVKRLAENALQELADALERGHSDRLTCFLKTLAHFHQYSATNVLLIQGQCPDATRVAGFRTWKKHGRFVRKGEKAIRIIAPLVRRFPQEADDNGDQPDDQELRALLGFKVVSVFDVSQTDGRDLPDFAIVEGNPGNYLQRLKNLVREHAITLEYRQLSPGCDGVSKERRIILQRDLSPAREFAVLAHEYAHALLHQGPLKNRPSRTVRETEAEAVAFVVCCGAGLETGTACSDYIQLYRGTKETLAESLSLIQKTATAILKAL